MRKLTRKDIGRWIWLSTGFWPKVVLSVDNEFVTLVQSDYSGLKTYCQREVQRFATYKEVMETLENHRVHISNLWPRRGSYGN